MSLKFNQFLILLLFSTTSFSQVENEVSPPDYIKTIAFKGNSQESQLPILKLGEFLRLEFDALNGDEDDFYYVIEHYNFDWTPSQLVKSEYLEGFDNQRIRNYDNSFNTLQIYSHYKLIIPNQYTRSLKVSGNYIIKIFDDYDELVFSRKFMVYENAAIVGVSIKQSRDVKFIEEKQCVDIAISSSTIQFNNPKQTVRALIIQNNNLNTTISNLKPMYTIGNQLIYKYKTESSFWAGNEFIFFENKDIRAANTGIQFIDLKELYHNYLFTDIARAKKLYTYNPDINGNFLITEIDAENPDIEADYAWIHFSLLLDDTFKDKNIYIYGNFNNYTIEENTKMNYDEYEGIYKNELLLKQGFYNYKYVVVDNLGKIDENLISGNFYQTENSYKVLTYYRELGARYDRIIGYGEANSVDISN